MSINHYTVYAYYAYYILRMYVYTFYVYTFYVYTHYILSIFYVLYYVNIEDKNAYSSITLQIYKYTKYTKHKHIPPTRKHKKQNMQS